MTGKRNVSKPVRFEEEFGYQTTFKMPCKEEPAKKKQREDKKLYDCEIVEVDVSNSRFKLHFVGYPDSDGQWQTFTEDELPVLRRTKPFEFSRETLEERTEAFKSALYTELKKRLLPTTRKDDPAVRVELPVQRDVYESVFCSVGVCFERHGNIIRKPTIEDLSSILGYNWNVRIKNVNGDFHFVKDRSLELWITERTSLQEYVFVGGKFLRQVIDQEPLLVLTFTRGRGNRTEYLSHFT